MTIMYGSLVLSLVRYVSLQLKFCKPSLRTATSTGTYPNPPAFPQLSVPQPKKNNFQHSPLFLKGIGGQPSVCLSHSHADFVMCPPVHDGAAFYRCPRQKNHMQLPIGRAAAAYKDRGNRVLVHDWFSATSLAQRCKEMNTTFWCSLSVVVARVANCFFVICWLMPRSRI